MAAVERSLAGLERAARLALGLLVLAMVAVNVANAAGRLFFARAINAADETLVFALVWLVFLGAILVTKERGHLGFDLLRKVLPAVWARALDALSDLAIFAVALAVAVQSWQVVGQLAAIGQRSMASGIPTWIPHAAILIGMGLTALVALAGLVSRFAGPGPGAGARDGGTGRGP